MNANEIDDVDRTFALLAAPFRDALSRKGQHGKMFQYIKAEQAMNRFDDVVGPGNWSFQMVLIGDIVQCDITIRLTDGRQITRSGASAIEARDGMTRSSNVKSAYADSFKVAARAFGVGRYLKWGATLDYIHRLLAACPDLRFHFVAEERSEENRTQVRSPGQALQDWIDRCRDREGWHNWYVSYGAEHGFPENISDWSIQQVRQARRDADESR